MLRSSMLAARHCFCAGVHHPARLCPWAGQPVECTSSPLLSSCSADYIAGNMSVYAAATNNALFAEQANIMLAACNSEAVPNPPTSFDYISTVRLLSPGL